MFNLAIPHSLNLFSPLFVYQHDSNRHIFPFPLPSPSSTATVSQSSSRHSPSPAVPQVRDPPAHSMANKVREWRLAMADEFNSLKRAGTWVLMPLTSSMNVLPNKWVFHLKRNSDDRFNVIKPDLLGTFSATIRTYTWRPAEDAVVPPPLAHHKKPSKTTTKAHKIYKEIQIDLHTLFQGTKSHKI
ncbi:unnamed protein product [Prunus armeniaca]|uniref:Reverse transcriptase Ty1/copia-type domain-containing protein n=1 Tax=Prunus armeniaca TaxID=36596 RepID=A0A6J5WHJ1_PRUAR|nr:hypothetical protein GBA52_008466 [Prunus armeniaca]CAB4299901.1 unnamed protein product [Prunus armeniaca]